VSFMTIRIVPKPTKFRKEEERKPDFRETVPPTPLVKTIAL
jgi:hypothetical protein